jgi:hypothetical protein
MESRLTDSNRRLPPYYGLAACVRIELRLRAICKHRLSAAKVTVFRLNAPLRRKTGSEPCVSAEYGEHVYSIEAAHNPEVAGSNPAPRYWKGPLSRAFLMGGNPRACGCATLSRFVRCTSPRVP